MAAVHTNARGTEPYDKVYCLGYQVHHEDWSPYPRINKLRQTFLDRGYDVDVERLRLVTQSYRQHEHLPEKQKVAYAFENVLLHCGIEICDDDLIVGEIASPIKSAPIYPEFSVNWILDEVQNHPFEQREHDQFTIRSEQEKQEILELCRWWKGRTLDDYINVRLDEDQLKGSEAGKKIYQTNLYHYAGTGHLAVDYARLMQLGFDGLLQRAREKLAALDMHDPEFCTKREFYQAVTIMYGAVKKYILRYAVLAEEMAAREQEAGRKAELEQIAANCRAVAGGTPKTFWQALQLFHFATMLICVESNGHSISYGRMDQWLYPYYQADKSLSKEFALELLEVEYVKHGPAQWPWLRRREPDHWRCEAGRHRCHQRPDHADAGSLCPHPDDEPVGLCADARGHPGGAPHQGGRVHPRRLRPPQAFQRQRCDQGHAAQGDDSGGSPRLLRACRAGNTAGTTPPMSTPPR